MTDSVPDDVHSRFPADHARHDRLLVTRFAGDDAYPGEADQARALVDTCTECAALAADIRLLIKSTAQLPRPLRTRDFRITPHEASALRGSAFDRFLRRLAGPRLAALRPIAGAALSVGLALAAVGVFLPAAVPAALPASAPDSGVQVMATPAAAEAPGAGEEGRPVEGEGDQPAAQPGNEAPPPAIEPDPAEERSEGLPYEDQTLQAAAPSADPARALLIYGGLGFAAISVAVLLLVTFARRRVRDPLLR